MRTRLARIAGACVVGASVLIPALARGQEAGLVWQKVPIEPRAFDWHVARRLCRTENTGGRQGWRLVFVGEQPDLVPGVRVFPKNLLLRAWCVRGGQGDHPYLADTMAGRAGGLDRTRRTSWTHEACFSR